MNSIEIAGCAKTVSHLVLGSDYFKTAEIDRVGAMLEAFLAAGGTTVDTAHNYGGGESEKAIGLWLRQPGNRERAVILTKGCYNLPGVAEPRVNPAALRHDLFTSLERLGADCIDLYALHRDDESVDVAVLVEELNAHVSAGRIRRFGASNWTCARLERANDYARKNGLQGFSFSSPNLSLAQANESWWRANVSVNLRDLDWYEKTRMPLVSWSSQARGFFTGRYAPEKRDDANMVRVFYSDDNWERYRRAETLARELGVSRIQVALAYVLSQPFPVAAIIGPQNEEELKSCCQAAALRLTRAQLRWLDLRADRPAA